MAKIILVSTMIILLSACSGGYIPLAVSTPAVSPSPLPAILSPTPPFIPSITLMATTSPTLPDLGETASPTPTETFTLTPVSTQTTGLVLDILGCNTSLDILHQMGEVTNAYLILRNTTANDLTNVCATLSASDEARVHPDKTVCLAKLPAGYQGTLKLTVDTGLGKDTSIKVVVSTTEDLSISTTRSSCREIGLPGWVPDKVGVIEPIP